MPTFSKPVQEEILQNARKKTLNPKLTSMDNVHEDAIKKENILKNQPHPSLPTQYLLQKKHQPPKIMPLHSQNP
jgi:hypothetical protein